MGDYIGLDWRTIEQGWLRFVAPWRIVCIAGHGLLVYESIFTLRPL